MRITTDITKESAAELSFDSLGIFFEEEDHEKPIPVEDQILAEINNDIVARVIASAERESAKQYNRAMEVITHE